jgi:hypothetical protein
MSLLLTTLVLTSSLPCLTISLMLAKKLESLEEEKCFLLLDIAVIVQPFSIVDIHTIVSQVRLG